MNPQAPRFSSAATHTYFMRCYPFNSAILAMHPSLLPSSAIFPKQTKNNGKGKLILKFKAHVSSFNEALDGPRNLKPPNGSLSNTRRDFLLEYVKNVKPEFMNLFVEKAPQQVVDAMRLTIANMIGTLPVQFFAVTVTTVAEHLAQLMYSLMMTGYMFKNAQYRFELQRSLELPALPDAHDKKDLPGCVPGTQKNVSGEVIRWNDELGPVRMDAKRYIELLEAEIEELNRQAQRKSTNGRNELLEYLKSLEPQNLKELTSSIGEDVVLAMNTFIKRLLSIPDPNQIKTSMVETGAPELATLLFWLMVVGYSLRNMEVRFDMERMLEVQSH